MMPLFRPSAPAAPPHASNHDAIRAGDRLAFRQLFDECWAGLTSYATSLVGDRAAADDFVQEAFVRLWDRRESLTPDVPPRAWLFRTVRNLALNERRDAATRTALLTDPIACESAAAPRPVVAPDAEATLPADVLARLLESGNKTILTKLLTFHVVPVDLRRANCRMAKYSRRLKERACR
jgi:RNA polymerase sigma factor (sigma-70 family)